MAPFAYLNESFRKTSTVKRLRSSNGAPRILAGIVAALFLIGIAGLFAQAIYSRIALPAHAASCR